MKDAVTYLMSNREVMASQRRNAFTNPDDASVRIRNQSPLSACKPALKDAEPTASDLGQRLQINLIGCANRQLI